jgi:hypothetical protein
MKAIQIVLGIFIAAISFVPAYAEGKLVEMTVYRSPTCGCCGKWIDHMKQNNFNVKDNITDDMEAIKARYGIPKEMASCHTAIVDGYVVEGHVPAADILKLLKTRPKVSGLAVPGMVTGSPGMEMGGRVDPYDVVSFDKEKHFEVFNHYSGK